MYIKVRAEAGAKKEEISKIDEDTYEIKVREPAERNMANVRIRELVARDLGIKIEKVKILTGHHAPRKILVVDDAQNYST